MKSKALVSLLHEIAVEHRRVKAAASIQVAMEAEHVD